MIDLYFADVGLMTSARTLQQKLKVTSDRQTYVSHVFVFAKMELKRRGWDKNDSEMRETDPCSLKALIDFCCLSQLRDDDDFATQREIVYRRLNEVVESMSRKKHRDFTKWEQVQSSPEIIARALNKALMNCTLEFEHIGSYRGWVEFRDAKKN